MKLIKNKNEIIPKLNMVSSYIRHVDNDYILSENEELVLDSQYIEQYFQYGNINYLNKRSYYMFLSTGFTNYSVELKDAISLHCSVDQNTIITYYMSKGMDMNSAIYEYIKNKSIDIRNAANCCGEIAKHPKLLQIIITYLSLSDATTFLDATRNFLFDYQNAALFGTEYSDTRDGIMDYINATGSYIGGGLSTYNINPPLTYDMIKYELNKLLLEGKID